MDVCLYVCMYVCIYIYINIDIYLPIKNESQLFIESEYVVRKILSCLSLNKAAGIDQISAKFLKEAADVLAYLLSEIINLLVKLSAFPKKCKVAKLNLLFKKGSKSNPKDCRLISLLHLVSKKY